VSSHAYHHRNTIEGHLVDQGSTGISYKSKKERQHLAADPIVCVDDYDNLDDHNDWGGTNKLFTLLISVVPYMVELKVVMKRSQMSQHAKFSIGTS
jgi:hypothetical protein